MAINPEQIDTRTVPQLDTVSLALTNFFAHSAPNGSLGKAQISDLAAFLAPYVVTVGESGYVITNGTVLPSPVEDDNKYTIVGAGTYTQTSGGNIITTQTINILSRTAGVWSFTYGLNASKGDKGDTGETGAKGDKGDRGLIGNRGLQGLQGVAGLAGQKGDKGDRGFQGADGNSISGASVATVADLATKDSTFGAAVTVRENRFGGHIFINYPSGSFAPNNGTVFSGANGTTWKMLEDGEAINIKWFGGVIDDSSTIAGDGNVIAVVYAKQYAGINHPIYFPQNKVGNGVYHFSTTYNGVDIKNSVIKVDKGIIFSSPAGIGIDETTILLNDLIFKNGIGNTYVFGADKKTYIKEKYINNSDFDRNKVIPLPSSSLVLGCFAWASNTEYPFQGSVVNEESVNISASAALGGLNYVGVKAKPNEKYTACFDQATQNASGILIGMFVKFKSGSWFLIHDDEAGGYGYKKKLVGQPFVEGVPFVKPLEFSTNDYLSYLIKRSVLSVQRVGKSSVAFFVNGKELIDRITIENDEVDLIGIASYNTVTPVLVQYSTLTLNSFVKGRTDLRIDIYGDSKSSHDKISWDNAFKEIMYSTEGVYLKSLRNFAIAGSAIQDQLNEFLANGINDADLFIASLGTNDIQNNSSASHITARLQQFLDALDGTDKKLVVIVPTLWYSRALGQGTGQDPFRYAEGANQRTGILRWCADNGVKVVDLLSIDPTVLYNTAEFTDGIHPNQQLTTMDAYQIAKAVCDAWLNQGGSYFDGDFISPYYGNHVFGKHTSNGVDKYEFSGGSTKTEQISIEGATRDIPGESNGVAPFRVKNTVNNVDTPDLQPVAEFGRAGKSGSTFGNVLKFLLGRYPNNGSSNALTRLQININDNNEETDRIAVEYFYTGTFRVPNLPEFPSNAAAVTGGLEVGMWYRNGADPKIVI